MKTMHENIIVEEEKLTVPALTKTRTIVLQKPKVVDVNKKRYSRQQEKKRWKNNGEDCY